MPRGAGAWLAGVVLWATLTPFLPRPEPWHLTLSPPSRILEAGGNLLLFMPLAFVFGRRLVADAAKRRTVLAAGVVLAGACLLVEGAQVFVEGRLVSPYDSVFNISGAWLGLGVGVVTGTSGARVRRITGRAFSVLLALTYVGILGLLAVRLPAAVAGLELRGWDADYLVRAADELGGGRAYRGEVSTARICAGAGPEEVCVSDGAAAGARRELVGTAERTQLLRIEARVRSASDRQYGPTRIVTFSSGVSRRNVTLGQSGDDLVLRLRTPVGGVNGSDYIFRLRDVLPAGMGTPVEARYREGLVRLRAGTGAASRSAEFRPNSGWLVTWLIAGSVDRAYPWQRLWAACAWLVVVVLPVGVFAQRLTSRFGA